MNTDNWWQGATTATNFLMLFQIGNTSSMWEGVTYVNSADITSAGSVELYRSSTTNTLKDTDTAATMATNDIALASSLSNDQFKGYLSFTGNPVDATTVYIQRHIQNAEQTLDDGTIVRMEAGRVLKGTYYQNDGTAILFSTTLLGAMQSFVSVAGITIASSVAMLAF